MRRYSWYATDRNGVLITTGENGALLGSGAYKNRRDAEALITMFRRARPAAPQPENTND